MTDDRRPLKLLFVKDRFNWPRNSGNDVHGSQMARALAARGHSVDVASLTASDPRAVSDLGCGRVIDLSELAPAPEDSLIPAGYFQRRYERYLGQKRDDQLRLARTVRDGGYDAVAVIGLNVMPLLRAVPDAVRVWYPADDVALLHWTLIRPFQPKTWKNVKLTAIYAGYERAFSGLVDRCWVVAPRDARVMRWVGGVGPVDLVPNGVDAEFYAPPEVPEEPNTCCFWGRLDFGSNLDAIDWFVGKVWPRVREKVPTAKFTIIGFKPGDRVRRAAKAEGVELLADLPDLREAVCRSAVTVLPFVGGAGIKNKLLEAAAMARPVVCTTMTKAGTRGQLPARLADSPAAFADALLGLFADAGARAALGRAARTWVTTEHGWDAPAAVAESGLYAARARKPAIAAL